MVAGLCCGTAVAPAAQEASLATADDFWEEFIVTEQLPPPLPDLPRFPLDWHSLFASH